MAEPVILHETLHRLRLALGPSDDATAVRTRVLGIDGVRSVRVNATLHCVSVEHDGRPATRRAVLASLRRRSPPETTERTRTGARVVDGVAWPPAAMAAAVPLMPEAWRPPAALAAIASGVVARRRRLRRDTRAELLDAASLSALALSGQSVAASASVLLRWTAERLSSHLVHEADEFLSHLLPTEASRYQVLRDPADNGAWSWWPFRQVQAGDRLRLFAGDVVPVDGHVADGEATLLPAAQLAHARTVQPGAHVVAGERLQLGSIELRAEADPAASRLERLRAHVRHAIGARDPGGRLSAEQQRALSLPLTTAALVLGFTGDTARAATMLQADPRQGLDLAAPLAREAALAALARQGLLASGLETIERLASAEALVLQDMGVLACGRWHVEAIAAEHDRDAERIRQAMAVAAGVPAPALAQAGLSDAIVRHWVRHGALAIADGQELHLASPLRLQRVWRLSPPHITKPASNGDALRRTLFTVEAGRVVATVTLASPLRRAMRERLQALQALGFKRMVVFVEDDGGIAPATTEPITFEGNLAIGPQPALRADWLAEASHDGRPVVMVHTVLRDLLPPGSVSLTPLEADAGSHGVLLGDPLQDLLRARRLACQIKTRVGVQRQAAAATDAALITASALQWAPPIVTALAHHGFSLLLLLDSMRLRSIGSPSGWRRFLSRGNAAGADQSAASPSEQRSEAS